MTFRLYLIAFTFGICLIIALRGVSSAGTYDVFSCEEALSKTNNSWQFETNQPTVISAQTKCQDQGSESGLVGEIRGVLAPQVPPGSYGRWVFTAPSGTTISALSIQRKLYLHGGTGWDVFGRIGDGRNLTGETCTVESGQFDCVVGGHHKPPLVEMVSTDRVTYGFECNDQDPCTSAGSIPGAQAIIYGSRITLEHNTPPQITSLTGEMLETNRRHLGVETASINATDETGIKEVRIYLAGMLQKTVSLPCDYTKTIPCSNPTQPVDITFDFAGRLPGDMGLEFGVVDAAGNETKTPVRVVKVGPEPPPPPPPSSPTAPNPLPALLSNPVPPLRPPAASSAQKPKPHTPVPSKGTPQSNAKRQLRIHTAIIRRKNRLLIVRGVAPRNYRGRVEVVYFTRVGKRIRRFTRMALVRKGQWDIRVRLVPPQMKGKPRVIARTKRPRLEASAPVIRRKS